MKEKTTTLFARSVIVGLLCLLPVVALAQSTLLWGKNPNGDTQHRSPRNVVGSPEAVDSLFTQAHSGQSHDHRRLHGRRRRSKGGESDLPQRSPRRPTVGALSGSVIALSILGESGIMHDINKFIYIGARRKGSPIKSSIPDEELGHDSSDKLPAASGVRLGAQSVRHSGYVAGRVFAYLMGLKEPRFSTGYTGPELDVALLRGEIDARSNLTTSVLTAEFRLVGQGDHEFPRHSREIPKGSKHPRFANLPGSKVLRELKQSASSPPRSGL